MICDIIKVNDPGGIQCVRNNGSLLSNAEIYKYLGIIRDMVLHWIATKNMPAHKIGKNWKFKVSEIDEWVNKGQAEDCLINDGR